MAETKTEGLIYKGHPLRRIDNLIYYGTMADKYIVMMQVLESKKENRSEEQGLSPAPADGPHRKGPGPCGQKRRKEQLVRGDGLCLHLAGAGAGRQVSPAPSPHKGKEAFR